MEAQQLRRVRCRSSVPSMQIDITAPRTNFFPAEDARRDVFADFYYTISINYDGSDPFIPLGEKSWDFLILPVKVEDGIEIAITGEAETNILTMSACGRLSAVVVTENLKRNRKFAPGISALFRITSTEATPLWTHGTLYHYHQ